MALGAKWIIPSPIIPATEPYRPWSLFSPPTLGNAKGELGAKGGQGTCALYPYHYMLDCSTPGNIPESSQAPSVASAASLNVLPSFGGRRHRRPRFPCFFFPTPCLDYSLSARRRFLHYFCSGPFTQRRHYLNPLLPPPSLVLLVSPPT
ncbi:hypothetical protein ACRALDRAFT_211134 [Sodiomyces alcalophilus JCM 7366]|uniref:uncharacterized protein n=1 Tax=Sodiomyces alcalophilus JCM 7366 TaxID=591952 RepID=UPI0039B4FC71